MLHPSDIDRILRTTRVPLRIPFELVACELKKQDQETHEKDPVDGVPIHHFQLTWKKKPGHFPAKGLDFYVFSLK